MVARLIEGWEASTTPSDYLGKWTSITSTGGSSPPHLLGSAYGRNGNGLRFQANSGNVTQNVQRLFAAHATWVVGCAVRLAATPEQHNVLVAFLDTSSVQCGLAVAAATGTLFAFRLTTATVLGTASAGLSPGVWAYVEVKATIHDTAGVFVVRVNGATVLDLSAQDTKSSANASANTVRLGRNGTGVTYDALDYDDVYVFDGSGSVNADFAGDCRVEQVAPTGAGASSAWTPSAGSNWDAVNDSPSPDGDSTYVSASTVATDTYACGDLSVATSGTVKCVQASALARKDDAGSRSIALVARPGSTDRVGATQTVADSYTRYAEVWDTNPDTGAAWSVAEVNACEAGVRLIA